MRNLPAAAIGLAVLLAGPTLAQAANESGKMTGQQQSQQQSQNNASIRQQVKNNLQQAGFSDIKIMPQSFLVRAKDKSGDPVMMVINPDSVTAVTEYQGQNNSPTANKD